MKIWLDDIRPAPHGWHHCMWPQEVIELMSGEGLLVDEVSLDHDLGDDEVGTGYDVLRWLEEKVHVDVTFIPPLVRIHTANPVARERMQAAVESIRKKHREAQKMKHKEKF